MGKQVIVALDNLIPVTIVMDYFQENCENLFDTKEFVDSGEENPESGLSELKYFSKLCLMNLL